MPTTDTHSKCTQKLHMVRTHSRYKQEVHTAGAHSRCTQQVHTTGAQSVLLKGRDRKQRSQTLPSALQHGYPPVLEDQREEPRKDGSPTANQGHRSYSKFSPNSQCEKQVHYLIVGVWDSGPLVFSAASGDRVPRLALLPFREMFLKEPALGSSSEELSSKEPRIKLVISCLLMRACFWSSLEGGVACWAGEDKPLVSGPSGPWATVQLVWRSGEVSLDDSGFLGGFRCEGGREFLCSLASLGPLGKASSSWSGVSDREQQSPCFCRGSSDLSKAGKDSSLERRLACTSLLVSGLESAIFPQIFRQENVR